MRKTVYICIGVAGVGKDTYISSRLNDKTVHISSDETRLKLFGTLDCQTGECHNKVFADMRNKLKAFLLDDKHEAVYYNATNLSRKNRRYIYDLIHSLSSNAKVVALAFLKPLNTILEQNSKRPVDKVVPSDKVVMMYKNLQVPRIGVDCDRIKLVNGNNFEDFRHEFTEDVPHDNPFHLETVYEHIETVSRLGRIGFPLKWRSIMTSASLSVENTTKRKDITPTTTMRTYQPCIILPLLVTLSMKMYQTVK